MHYNLLNPANPEQQSSIGYAWLEFGQVTEDGPRYLTIGAGLKARRTNDQVESWFFILRDRRIDVDFWVFDKGRLPRSRIDLEREIGTASRVFLSAKDYRAAVNRELYGLDGQQYEDLIEALLRLRQPHLSERLDPAAVAEVLSDSLSPLDGEKVRGVAEGLERLEKHRRELSERRLTLDAVKEFLREYKKYVHAIASARSAVLTASDWRVRDTATKASDAKAALAAAIARQDDLTKSRDELTRTLDSTRVRIHTIETSDGFRAVQQLEEAEARARDETGRAASLRERVREAQERVKETGKRLAAARGRVTEQEAAVGAHARVAVRAASAAGLSQANGAIASQLDGAESASALQGARGTAAATSNARRSAIEELRGFERSVAEAQRAEAREVERLTAAEDAHRAASASVVEAEESLASDVDAHGEAIERWSEGLEVLAVPPDDLARLIEDVPEEAGGRMRSIAAPVRDRLDSGVSAATLTVSELQSQSAQVEAERTALAAATHQPPPAPEWRTADRARMRGAPLYLLIEFNDALDAGQQGGTEAALEAAGLLDAWVTPDGKLLAAGTYDSVVLPADPCLGRSLADCTAVTPCGEVPADAVRSITSCIAVLRSQDVERASAVDGAGDVTKGVWAAVDGRFHSGLVYGAASPRTVAYVGETARTIARARRLAELEARLLALGEETAKAEAGLRRCRDRRATLDVELDRFPSIEPILRARANLDSATHALERATTEVAARRVVRDTASAASGAAARARDEAALRLGLSQYLQGLDALAAATTTWSATVAEWIGAVEVRMERRAAAVEVQRADEDAAANATTLSEDLAGADSDVRAANERVITLSKVVGSTADEIRHELHFARSTEREAVAASATVDKDLIASAASRGAQQQASTDASAEHERAERERERAAADFRALARLDVLRYVVSAPPQGDPEQWGIQVTLGHARAIAKDGPEVPGDEAVRATFVESAQNAIGRSQQELQKSLVAGVRPFGHIDQGVLIYDVQYQGESHSLYGLVDELAEDVSERESRLAKDEQALLEAFLTGELHAHLRERMRGAASLVERMNVLLGDCPTAAGQRLRLSWQIAEESPAGTEQAVELLLRGSALLTSAHREQLREWLHQRLREAREGDVASSLQERIASAFDYRRWHSFTVEFRDAGSASWRKLTRLTHGAGSGGEKAVMLHLPLFAAMAAHYHGSGVAPRLIVLDEVFAGIDRGTRGQLMRLLVQLDLDALFTSHDEWGFYSELDGISTYHLIRDPEKAGVLSEWFVWDGSTRWEMAAQGREA
jgi:uncharacterized protein (TIGR02680 family)